MNPNRFGHFVAIDWSGAAGERLKGIALAIATRGKAAPQIVRPGHRWSREDVLAWLRDELPDDALVGMDLGISLPFADRGGFFPGWPQSPATARELWALIDAICADEPHLGVAALVDHPELCAWFRRHGGREGAQFGGGMGRFRVTEAAQRRMGCKPYSNFNLVGAAQVGKSSLSGMRLLHRLGDRASVWPIDGLPTKGPVICEIYTTIAAMAAGRTASRSKMRSAAEADEALVALGSACSGLAGPLDDHTCDALVTAAWLRTAAHDLRLWHPRELSDEIAHTEGWTFGAI
ncbi:MAG: hypothetical protein B7Y36_12945 [Novosphingobium sp. 28-62-57]|uniref:hypothetical protein n=1 Tax=unclassified Novosphingobium TaxID=2644732 RepID=UPI000BCCC618|nr:MULTISPECIES: hypothetical protein [unclassified Novosphingobium]OYW48338.1 MAG: hypothetical protein B7Z34_14320 [Novosphingobium sp. 12-62-10]OYZ09593.1 MAG: hypothetical protein B7Y36_12945 [Novosphingobium sp. 28-62-57]OZA33868.1 MAG: hypothetical protein B7X92_10915 [Novosphingobium sp. 17-62-9]HQS70394.1 hypothetical protein [Novosphingobium sp.]